MSRLVETVAPARLGSGFRWLLASSWVSNLGDGIALAAGPLLIASQTQDARLVASAVLLQQLPWLLFGLFAGALSDRLDRRLIVVTVDLLRTAVLVLLAASIVTGVVSVPVVLLALFLLGTAEVFADNASGTLLPMTVPRADLAIANARLQTGFITVNQLAGPPLGAALFAAGAASPFVAQAVLVGMGALLVSRMRVPAHRPEVRSHVRRDIADGFRWVRHHAAVRTLVLTIFTFNITFGAAWSVLVLYASERLGLGEIGFGLLTTVSAVGGLAGTAAYGWITRRISLGDLMRIGLVVETLTHLALALTTSAPVAMVVFFVFGAHAFIWGTTSVTVRQRAVPTALQGRVGSVNAFGVYGGLVVGAALGGVLAEEYGITAPFWFAFVGSAVFCVLIWGQLAHIAHADEQEPGREDVAAGQGSVVADFDITVLIRSEHDAFRRAFTEIEGLTDKDELATRWRELSDQLEVHAAGEEQVFYPELLQDVDDSEGDTEHAVKDHNEIRETTRKVDDHEVGSDAWWEAFREAREATVDHLGEEETDVLPPFQEQVDEEKRGELGMRWMKFLEDHENAKGLSREEPDPKEYVEEHSS